MKEFTYCGICYTDGDKPFGLCNNCWIKYNKPQAMKVDGD